MPKLVTARVVFGALAMLAAASCASSQDAAERTAESSAAVSGGADTSLYPFAVSVCVPPTTKDNCNACSGTLIAPNLVLTARHCLYQTPGAVDCATSKFGPALGPENGIWIGTSENAKQNAVGWHPSKKVFIPTKDAACGNDIALVVLADMIPASEATPVEPAVQYPLTDHSRYATDFTVIGYGLTNGCANGGGRRRIRQNVRIRCLPGDPVLACPASQAPEEMVVGAGFCPGDSGSGDFEQSSFDSGKPVVFGVSVRSGDAHIGISTRTDTWRDLIVEAASFAAADKGYPPPAWTKPVPPQPKDAGADTGASSDGGGSSSSSGGVTAPSKNPGEACATTSECVEGACIVGAAGGVCAKACDPKAPSCGAGELCVAVEDTFVCRKGTTKTTTTESGCAASPASPAPSLGALALVGLALAAAAARRRAR